MIATCWANPIFQGPSLCMLGTVGDNLLILSLVKVFCHLNVFSRYKSEHFKAVLKEGRLTGSKDEIKQYNCKTQHLIENNDILFWLKSTMIAYFTTEQIKYF